MVRFLRRMLYGACLPLFASATIVMNHFSLFEHTADVGLRVHSKDLNGLFSTAAQGVFALILENPKSIEPRLEFAIELASEDLEGLFVDWLRELIYRFEADHLLLCDFRVEISVDHGHLKAQCRGEPVDWNRHSAGNEVKAATYHGLRVRQSEDGWEAEVILDI